MKEQKNNNIKEVAKPDKRYVLIALPIIFLLMAFNVLPVILALVLASVVVAYFLLKDYAWLLVILSPFGLVFGTIIDFEIQPNWIYEISFTEVFIMLALAIYLIDLFFNENLRPKLKTTGLLLLLYLLLAASSFWQVKDYELYVAGLKTLCFSLAGYFLALNLINTPKRRKQFFYVISATVALLSLQVFYKFYELGFSIQLFNERNVIGIPMGAIAFVSAALAFLLPLILTFYFDLKKTEKGRVLVLLSFVLGFVAVFVMLGKAAIFSLIIALGYLFIKLKIKRVAFILFLSLFALISYIGLSDYSVGLVKRLTNIGNDSSTQFRLQEYHTAYKIVEDNFWLGVGSGQQLKFYQRMIHPEYSEMINNYFLQALVDFGVVGLAIYALLAFSILLLVRKTLKVKSKLFMPFGFTAAMIAVALNGLVEVTVFALPYALPLWLVIGTFQGTALKNE